MDGVTYREKMRRLSPDVTDDDILRLYRFRPRLTAIAFSIKLAFRRG